MGSLPNISILKGDTRPFTSQKLYRLFENIANKESPENLAVIYEESDFSPTKSLTYKQLELHSNQLARQIVNHINNAALNANTDGDYIVAVSMPPTDKLIVTLLAIWKAGCAYLPLDPTFPKTRVEHILNESKPVLVIYDNSSISSGENSDTSAFDHTLALDINGLLSDSRTNSPAILQSQEQFHHEKDDLAIVLYTSGSTGVPKGVRLPFSIIVNRLQWQWREFPYSLTEKFGIFKTALTFVDSVSEIWGPLLNGLAIVVVPKKITKDPVQLVNVLEKYQIERLVLVPSLLRSLIFYFKLESKTMNSPLQSLRIWVCSGESLPAQLVQEFFENFNSGTPRQLCNFYGSTEIMGDVTYYTMDSYSQIQNYDKVPIGEPIDNTIIYLLDEHLKPVSVGNVGELYVSGANLAAGYVNGRDPDKFIENPLVVDPIHSRLYKTGDYARIVKGKIVYEGRTDSQIKVRGHRVDLSEVERQVASIPGVEKAVALCYKAGELDQALVAFVTVNNPVLSGIQIEEYLREKLTEYMIPQVVVLDSIPLLVNGKTDRQTLLKIYDNRNQNSDDINGFLQIDLTDVAEDKINMAKILFETVASVIGRSARNVLNINSNFYQLGGNSLNSIYTVTKLRDCGYNIGITDFLRSQSLGEILDKLRPDNSNTISNRLNQVYDDYTTQPLTEENRKPVCEMIASSFYEKAELESWLKPNIIKEDYVELLAKSWEPLVEKDLSFVVCRKETGEPVGVALNFDARDEPDIQINSKLSIIFEFLEYVEGPIRDNKLPPGKGTVLHSFMMATEEKLTTQENVLVIQVMEEETLRLAKRKGFLGIFTTNTSPLTQQLGIDIYGYQVMLDYQINKYVASDNSKPFGKAPDDQRAIVCWKTV